MVTIFAFVLNLINKFQKNPVISLNSKQEIGFLGLRSDKEIGASKNYFFWKADSEKKHFVKENEYHKI